jgi:hypothetical protein
VLATLHGIRSSVVAAVLPLAVTLLAAGDPAPPVTAALALPATAELARPVDPPVPISATRRETCPGFVRALLKLDPTASVTCAPGRFPEDGYFVRGFYTTSELWERVAVVSADGSRLVAPFQDLPSRLQRDGDSASLVSIDLDGDGIDEVLTSYRVNLDDRTEIGVETRRADLAIEYRSNRQLLSENLCAPCKNIEILRAGGASVRHPRCRDRRVDDLVVVRHGRPTR